MVMKLGLVVKITECLAHRKCSVNVIINTLYLFCVLWFTSSRNCRVHESKFWGLTCLSLKLWHLELGT